MSSEREGDIHTIALTGELDLANAPMVEDELTRVEGSDAVAIIVDLSGLTFIDSTGIRLLVSAQARARSDAGRLTLLRGQAPVQRVFELSGVAELLPFGD
jgi:anti-sigma B factor antagonist